MKQPTATAPKPQPPEHEDELVETVYVKRPKAKKVVVKNKPVRRKKVVYVESSSSEESDSSSDEEIQYVKRRSRKPKQRLASVPEEPAPRKQPAHQQSMFQFHDNGDVMW